MGAAEFRPETLVAVDAVQYALTIARGGVSTKDIAAKGERDLVTATDVAVEDAVRKLVTEALGAWVIGEERGGEAPADGSPYWLVDPICGTRNYASGIPLYVRGPSARTRSWAAPVGVCTTSCSASREVRGRRPGPAV